MNDHDQPEDALRAPIGDATAGPGASIEAMETAPRHDVPLPQASDAPAALAVRLAEYHRRRATLFEWIHPLRLADVPCGDQVHGRQTHELARLAEAFLDQIGLISPPLYAFGAPGTALTLLPARECLTVLRLRALCERVDEVRAWIDRPRRKLLSDWIGPHGVRLLLGPRHALAGLARPLSRQRPLGAGDGDALAWIGLRLFEHDFGWAADNPLALLQLALPASAACGSPAGAPPVGALPVVPGGPTSHAIVSQLPNLFPEWSW